MTATELAIKAVLLKPIVFGLVPPKDWRRSFTDLTMEHTGMDRFKTILTEIFALFGGVDLRADEVSTAGSPFRKMRFWTKEDE